MAWYSATYRRRAAITVDIPGTSPVDVNITIPTEWDDFWTTIDASANNLRVVWYDGKTVLSYAVDDGAGGAFSSSARTGRIRIDGMVVPTTASQLLIWLYWDPTSNQSSGAVAVTITSARDGYIELGSPGQHQFAHRPQTPRTTRPRDKVHKTVNEQAFVWIRLDRALGKRFVKGRGGQRHEEPLHLTQQVLNSGGSDQAAMYDQTKARFVESPTGEMWARLLVKAGSTATFYTLVVLTRTIQPGDTSATQQLETRIGIAVRDNLDS